MSNITALANLSSPVLLGCMPLTPQHSSPLSPLGHCVPPNPPFITALLGSSIGHSPRCADQVDTVLPTIIAAVSLTIAILMVATAFRTAVAVAVDRMQRSAIISALKVVAYNQNRSCGSYRPPPGVQWGGGGESGDEPIEVHVSRIAGALRSLGEIVNAPGLKAIKGVLLVLKNHCQTDAAEQSGSTVKSIRKYQPLVKKVLATACAAAGTAAAASAAGPIATAVACGAAAAVVMPPVIRSLPSITNVSLKSEIYQQDGQMYRVWRATVRESDGTVHEQDTHPVLHEPPPSEEAPDERRKREHREHERVVRALRALDARALAAHRAKDRTRKRTKAAQRLSFLPALPIPDGDPVWNSPLGERPHFIGEHVWLLSPDALAPPQLATIQDLWRDGSADVIVQQTRQHMRQNSW